ncbi:unnamed protein product [Ilex paraguariensis]|uniref:DC1 domain-containing protein n=1 Tax=Ilex paraguariensis TaxID=185542 RepID=A0ABC8SQ47_9AQUA
MEELKHFGHFHPLILGEVREVNLYVICHGCKKPISGVVYWCNKCDWYLHRKCAELPQEIIDPLHPDHLLTMDSGDRAYTSWWDPTIDEEYTSSLDPTMECDDSEGEDLFWVDPAMKCGDIRDYICSLCRESRRDGFFYRDYIYLGLHIFAYHVSWRNFDDQHHPLTLVKPYSSDVPLKNQKDYRICGLPLTRENWLYYCALCHYQTHVRCSISRSKRLRDGKGENEEDDQHLHPNLLHFPLTDDFVVLPKHPVEQISRHENEEIKRETKIKSETHKNHELILYNGQGQNNTQMIKHNTISSCDMCVKSISLPFYTCVQCNHFIHLSCANLPAELERPIQSTSRFVLHLSLEKGTSFSLPMHILRLIWEWILLRK